MPFQFLQITPPYPPMPMSHTPNPNPMVSNTYLGIPRYCAPPLFFTTFPPFNDDDDPSPGPLLINSPSPRSFHAGSRTFCVALVIPNAACWSGTTSSSSSGLMGCRCGG